MLSMTCWCKCALTNDGRLKFPEETRSTEFVVDCPTLLLSPFVGCTVPLNCGDGIPVDWLTGLGGVVVGDFVVGAARPPVRASDESSSLCCCESTGDGRSSCPVDSRVGNDMKVALYPLLPFILLLGMLLPPSFTSLVPGVVVRLTSDSRKALKESSELTVEKESRRDEAELVELAARDAMDDTDAAIDAAETSEPRCRAWPSPCWFHPRTLLIPPAVRCFFASSNCLVMVRASFLSRVLSVALSR